MQFFCLPLSSLPRLNLLGTQQQGRAPPHPVRSLLLCAEEVEPRLNTQWQTEKLHVLLAEDGHTFLTCLQLVGTWVQNIFRNLVPDFWRVMFQILRVMACQYPACQYIPRRVMPYFARVSVSVPCRGRPAVCVQ